MTGPADWASAGKLCPRIEQVIAEVRPAAGDGAAARILDAIAARLRDGQLRIAVGGRLKAGKSTMINALVGQKVAATGATECTMLVAWFRACYLNRIEVKLVSGESYYVPGKPGGGVPDDLTALGAPRSQISEIVVEVVNDRLAGDYTIVDTPGMDALSGLDAIAMSALTRADALLYVMPHPGEGDMAALEALRQQASRSISAVNVLGVLSRIDELGDGITDPWPGARRLAATYSARLNGLVATTVPIVGLLAETALGDAFTEYDTQQVARLADSAGQDPASFRNALYSARSFRGWQGGPLTAAERDRLLGLLGRHGLHMATEAHRRGVTGPVALRAELRRCSGIDELLTHIHTRFTGAADRLRAASALAVLDGISPDDWDEAAGRQAFAALRVRLAELRGHPALRQAELGAALADLVTGRLRLTAPETERLLALATGNDAPACLSLPQGASNQQIAAAADAMARSWRGLEDAPSRVTSRHARTAREFCEALYFSVRDPGI
jgi:hypothetical protein